ncbi:hypothetical protein M0L20_14810 [Spirosoma sp. RP8]|uniref:Uncharacterized protein n=1 Tax=Spirosoma liriopis TaxID=2937440 RepID=A0ABT0HLU9_9BACT|nr:hypothetical protein [Spirosoma liriopis]MCK8493138.1 hypothetical protein [Spirosoma liriopis]
MMNHNSYIKDSLVFFEIVSKGIKHTLSDSEVVNLTMLFALGLERILKGILYSVNPIYILVAPEFKNSLPIFYKSKIIADAASIKEIADNPNEDVITFKNSLLRAQIVSKVTYDNKSLLFTIANARDIIAHHELSKLNYETLKLLLLRDYYPLMKSFADELIIKNNSIFHGKHIQLAKYSSKLQDTIEKQIELRFDAIRATFKMLKNNPGYISDKDFLTRESFNKGNKFITVCPCCENEALIYSKPIFEFNHYTKIDVKIGYEIKKLKCFYCKLEIEDYKELDYLEVSIPKQDEQEHLCARCGEVIDNDSGTGLCAGCDEYYGTEN